MHTRGVEGGRKEQGWSSSVLLTRICKRRSRGSPQETFGSYPFTGSRTTRSRFLQSFAIPYKAVQLQLSRGKRLGVCYLHTQPTAHNPHHTPHITHTTTTQHTARPNTYNTETESRQRKRERRDKTRLHTAGYHYESWFLLSFTRACFELLTTLTFRALHGDHVVSTPFQTVV